MGSSVYKYCWIKRIVLFNEEMDKDKDKDRQKAANAQKF